MKRLLAVVMFLFVGASPASAIGAPPARAALDPTTAEAHVHTIVETQGYSFCTKPDDPLPDRARQVCPLAGHVPGCSALVALCDKGPEPLPQVSEFWKRVLVGLGKILPYVAWVLMGALLLGVLYLAARAWKASRDEAVPEDMLDKASDVTLLADAPLHEPAMGAELLFRRAAEARARGDRRTALFLYLAAAIRALGDRGAVRIARDRTHGEYVRSCQEATARPKLRELVREVDVVQFGGGEATDESVARAEHQAEQIVRPQRADPPAHIGLSTLTLGALLVFSIGAGACKGGGFGSRGNPAGRELLVDLLEKQGADIVSLPGSLANLPMHGGAGPVVVLDADRVPLEEETRAHLVAWVKQGGTLVLAGDPDRWPSEFWAKPLATAEAPKEKTSDDDTDRAGDATKTSTEETARVKVETRDAPPAPVATPASDPSESDDDVDIKPKPRARPRKARAPYVHHAVVAHRVAMTWPNEDTAPRAIARFEDGELYGALRDFGEGKVLGLASADLLTNVGLAVPGNAAALIALLATTDGHEFAIARREQGISPPSNPFAGLVHIGLGPALVHVVLFLPLLFVAYGIRQAAPKEEPPNTRRAFAEHIQAVGGLYARRRAARHALAVYARHVDERVRAAMGRGSDPVQFLASRGHADLTATAELYRRAQAAIADGVARGDELADLQSLSTLYARAMSKT